MLPHLAMASAQTTLRAIGGTCRVEGIGFGGMSIAGAFYISGVQQTDEERLKLLDRAYDLNCRHWDSAAVYNDCEELIGKWLARTGKREDIFLVTKAAPRPDPQGGWIWDCSKEWISQSIDRSLARLGVESIDLFYLHRVDKNLPIEVPMQALADEVKAGRIKHIGLSEVTASTLRRAHAVHPVAALQMEYSIFALEIEEPGIDLLTTCRELGVKMVAYSPLARGLLTGRYVSALFEFPSQVAECLNDLRATQKSPDDFHERDVRRIMPRFLAANFPSILQVVDALREIGKAHNATPAQVALAWVLAQGDDIFPIPGTRSIEYLEENFAARDVHLTSDEIARVRQIAETIGKLPGPRDHPRALRAMMADTPSLDDYLRTH